MSSLTKEQEFAMFDTAVKAIVDANALMLSVCYADLLKLIAYDDPIRITIKECYDSIDYEHLLTTVFEKNGDKYVVRLPASKKAIVGFVTKLIYEFHLGTQSYDKILLSLYGDSSTFAMKTFAEEVLNPYREAFRQVFMFEADENAGDGKDEDFNEINPAVFNEIKVISAAMRSEIEGDNKIKEEERKELIELIDGFCYAVESEQGKLVRPSWIGLRKALTSAKLCANALTRLEALLQRYMLA